MRLILVRHAETGHDGPLSDHGRRHAEVIAREIASVAGRTLPVDAIYTAPETASSETAAIIADVLAIASPLTESAFEGSSLEADTGFLEAAQTRAWSAVEAIQEAQSPDCTLVIVSHELPVRLLVCRALSIPLAEMHRFRIDPASLTTLDFRVLPQRRTILAGLNETCHVDEVTGSK